MEGVSMSVDCFSCPSNTLDVTPAPGLAVELYFLSNTYNVILMVPPDKKGKGNTPLPRLDLIQEQDNGFFRIVLGDTVFAMGPVCPIQARRIQRCYQGPFI